MITPTYYDLPLSGTAMASTITSDAITLDRMASYSIQVVWSGGTAPVGTFKLQCSNDFPIATSGSQPFKPTNWTDVTSSPQAITGTPGSIVYDVTVMGYAWARLIYTPTSGSGTIAICRFNARGV